MKYNRQDQKLWDEIFSEVPSEWTTAEPTQHMRDCLRFFESRGVKSVLDVGCGIGIWATFLSRAGMQVKGCDFSPKAIDFAERWASELKLEIQYTCCPITETAFPAERFDAVLAAKVLDNVTPVEAEIALHRISESLKDAGVVYALFSPHLSEAQIAELEQSDNPTKNITHTNFTDDELRELFAEFKTLKFRLYDDGFRGLWLAK